MLVALALWSTGCGGGNGGQEAPLGGLWLGDHVDFALCDGEVRTVQVQDVSCAAIRGGETCSRDAAGTLSGAWTVIGGEVSIQAPNIEISGYFDGPDRFVGTYTYLDAACCAVTGDLVVRHESASAGCDATPDTIDPSDAVHADDIVEADPTGEDDGLDTAENLVQTALDLINAARVSAGTAPITADARIVQAAQAHAEFVAKHFNEYNLTQMSVHDEDESWSGFTGLKFRDRLEYYGYDFNAGWEIVAFYNDPRRAVAAWIETVYHRVPILHPNALQVGYGHAEIGGARVDVLDFAAGYDAASDRPVAWPYEGMLDVSPSWSGLEDPKPYLPPQGDPTAEAYEPDGYPSGPVVTLEFPFGHDVTASTFALTDSDGAEVPSQLLGPPGTGGQAPYHFEDDAHLLGTYSLIPFDPIAPHTTFTVHFVGTLDGAPFEKTWDFTTR